MLHHSESESESSTITDDDDDTEFTDALDYFIFSNPQHSPEPNPLPSSTGILRRRLFSRHNSKQSNVSSTKGYNFSLNLKDNHKQSTFTDHDVSVDDPSVTVVNSSNNNNNNGSNFVFTLARLITKLICLKVSLFVTVVTFPLWFTHSCHKFVTNPFAVMRRVKRRVSRFCLGEVRRIVFRLVKRNKYVWKLCGKVGWGLVCSVFVGLVLVCLLLFAFVVGGVLMRCIVEVPLSRIEQLSFDYTRDSPVAFVPVTSCSEVVCLECVDKIGFDNVGLSRVIPRDRKLQSTVSLTLPESGYNRNLGNFQVRVDFLSRNGKPLASATQPCTMRFKSWPIRLLTTVFNLGPLVTGYSSESQTVDIKFNGYTERETPTSCMRVALEPRAEFAKGGGVPEIYTAYLKLESQLPLLKRVLWSWKATVFVWTSIAIFKFVLVFVLLCCAPWLRLSGGESLNNAGSR